MKMVIMRKIAYVTIVKNATTTTTATTTAAAAAAEAAVAYATAAACTSQRTPVVELQHQE